jgi:hypothetical protein
VCSRQGDELTYHRLADETLDELTDFFEDLGERTCTSSDFDAFFSVKTFIERTIVSPPTSFCLLWKIFGNLKFAKSPASNVFHSTTILLSLSHSLLTIVVAMILIHADIYIIPVHRVVF